MHRRYISRVLRYLRGTYDYVEVIDGENENGRLWGKFCGKIAPPPVVSSGPFLFIKFVSDYETHGAGFSIRYEVFKRGLKDSQLPFHVTAIKQAQVGVLPWDLILLTASQTGRKPLSSKHPQWLCYPTGQDLRSSPKLGITFAALMVKGEPCQDGLRGISNKSDSADQMSEIILEFESFDLEPDSNPPGGIFCRYDRLEIWDGFPDVGPHIGRYCGQKTPGRIRSSSGILSMVLYTDTAIAKEGFSANYTVLQSSISEDFKCMEALGMESGEILSDQITASSQYSTNWSAERSRLNYPENGWTPGEDSYREWIQVCSTSSSLSRVEYVFDQLERLLKESGTVPNGLL
ncbi:Asparagine-rich protein (ARP protein) [Saguinus oedipus]|uniref:Asparagine-rich protein (ARP protein) n=1 Tax=Saguinus oedipus TaxID=9490 RepID=A0ABQ9V7C6_SAGOE|nr:Asparagine-rich protein (ARP protein) [Saguinus oedipus]